MICPGGIPIFCKSYFVNSKRYHFKIKNNLLMNSYYETNKEKFKQYYKTYYYKNKDKPQFAEKKRLVFKRYYYKTRHNFFWNIFQSWEKKNMSAIRQHTLCIYKI